MLRVIIEFDLLSTSKFLLIFFLFFRWDPKKRMTPDEAVHHEWLQPSSNSSYNQNKVTRNRQECGLECSQQQLSSPKSQKFSMVNTTTAQTATTRQLHQTQHMILPEVKTPSKYANYKLYKDRTKGN